MAIGEHSVTRKPAASREQKRTHRKGPLPERGVKSAARQSTGAAVASGKKEQELAAAVERVSEGIVIMDAHARILYANPAAEAHFGLGRHAMDGLSYIDVLQKSAADAGAGSALHEAIRAGKAWTHRLVQEKSDGTVCGLDITVFPVRAGSGRLTGFAALQRDVTQEVRLQEHARQLQKMEALGTLAGGIAHDFNNILLPILINTELALLEDKTDGPAARRLEQVLEAARRGREVVKQILGFAQPREQEARPVEITPILTEALKFLRVSIPKNIKIVDELQTTSALIVADPAEIHQILINLCSNAAYAMRDEGGLLKIRLSETEICPDAALSAPGLGPGPYVVLSVSDTGQGMTSEVMERMFDPFFTTKTLGEGTGMGLSVVQGIVRNCGGVITCSSEPGKGTVFEIFLPRITERRLPRDLGEALPNGTERILFVDDEEIQVRAVGRLLTYLGYHVTALGDSRKALELLRRQPEAFDLLITDLTMPSVSGEQLAREARKLRPRLPVILCTGYSEMLDEAAALAAGIKAFVMKPFSVKEIAETIRAALEGGA